VVLYPHDILIIALSVISSFTFMNYN